MDAGGVKIYLGGYVDDLYAISLLFPAGAHPTLHIVTQIKGSPKQGLHVIENADQRETYVTGEGCIALTKAGAREVEWIAREIISPLNGYAVLADSNFRPVWPTAASWKSTNAVFGSISNFHIPVRHVSTGRHTRIRELLPSRVAYMTQTPLAAYAAAVISRSPSWADYYRLLEDIAGHRGITLDKLSASGLAEAEPLNAFKKAANNREFGRHGTSKRDTSLAQADLMNLLEAREFVRRVVSSWLDTECGDRMPRDRVDGGQLRFGLDK